MYEVSSGTLFKSKHERDNNDLPSIDDKPKLLDTVLLNTFTIKKKRYRVLYSNESLVWQQESVKNNKVTVPLDSIISIDANYPADKNQVNPCCTSNNLTERSLASLTINYAADKSKTNRKITKLRCFTIKFFHKESRIIQLWEETLRIALNDQNWRPKHLLIFINPFGGRRQGLQIYEKYCKKIFRIAGIEADVIISQRSNQIRDILLNQSLDQYNGVVCVGGDGTFSEVFNGLVARTMKDIGVDMDEPEFMPRPTIPIGVIPAGSTDTVAYCLFGTSDIRTAALYISLGQIGGLDISAVYNGTSGNLLKLYASVLSYGYLGDVALESEKYRWMGPKRYDFAGFKKLILNRGYEAELSILLDESSDPTIGPACLSNCKRCIESGKQTVINSRLPDPGNNSKGYDKLKDELQHQCRTGEKIDEASKWKTVNGKFFMINSANISCACIRSPNGFSKYAHLGDGNVDIIIVRHTSFLNNIRLLIAMTRKNSNLAQLPFIEIYRAKKFQFKTNVASINNDIAASTLPFTSLPIDANDKHMSNWNCDGEIMFNTSLTVKSYCQLVKVFMRKPICGSVTTENDNKAFEK